MALTLAMVWATASATTRLCTNVRQSTRSYVLTLVPVGFNKGFSFKPGHVTSIEPGFYLEGRWGMRIESVYICKGVEVSYPAVGIN